ncbi:MAG: hypothetical protein VKJ46_07340 [Leptolyngbyaceae bacterium]|nr:hypothetical protein [Leptolyngbyaceae bacterium]
MASSTVWAGRSIRDGTLERTLRLWPDAKACGMATLAPLQGDRVSCSRILKRATTGGWPLPQIPIQNPKPALSEVEGSKIQNPKSKTCAERSRSIQNPPDTRHPKPDTYSPKLVAQATIDAL